MTYISNYISHEHGDVPALRRRIVNNLVRLFRVFPDKSLLPAYYNSWHFDWQGKDTKVFLQRWCRGLKKFQVNYIRIESDGKRLIKSDLFKLANWLTDHSETEQFEPHSEQCHINQKCVCVVGRPLYKILK